MLNALKILTFDVVIPVIWDQHSILLKGASYDYLLPYSNQFLPLMVRSIKSNMSRIRESIHNKMELGTSFYNYLVSKISKIALFGLGEFFYFNKLPTRLFSWNISIFKVSECRIFYFLRLFITKYFMTIHTYQIMIFSPLLYWSWWTSL